MTHQQLLAQMSESLQKLTAEVIDCRRTNRVATVSHTNTRLAAVEHELASLALAARLAGAMPEEARAAFEGVPA